MLLLYVVVVVVTVAFRKMNVIGWILYRYRYTHIRVVIIDIYCRRKIAILGSYVSSATILHGISLRSMRLP